MKKSLIDLHTHSYYSDGEFSPIDICNKAKEAGVSVLSITDHNTVDGCKELFRINKDLGVRFIPGIELDVNIDFGKLQILGYNIDVFNEDLERIGKKTLEINLKIFRMLLETLKTDYAIGFDDEEVEKLVNKKFQVGKMDVAILLLNHGYVKDLLEAFDRYINQIINNFKYKPSYPSYEEVLYAIKKSGGVSSLAHPKSLKRNYIELSDLIKKLKGVGLNSIEVYHSSHSTKQVKLYRDLAQKYNLLVSGGSDYHGDIIKPEIEIATGNNNLNIRNLSILRKIK